MRILVLHTDVPPDAPPDDQDTLKQAVAVEATLSKLGYETSRAVFASDPSALKSLIENERPDLVFNLVETIWGSGYYAALAPAMLARFGVPFTGGNASVIAACCDKIMTKRLLAGAGLPTPAWSEPPHWKDVGEGRWIVKSVTEDASLGLDDDAVVQSREHIIARAKLSTARHGGQWFAERYIAGREFNVALIERSGEPVALPIGEMTFEHWDENRPQIIGYGAKWDENDPDYRDTARIFDWAAREPDLYSVLENLSKACWKLFGLAGYARVDFRVDEKGQPFILELNPNPCLEPDAGVAAAAEQAGLSYDALVDAVVKAVPHG